MKFKDLEIKKEIKKIIENKGYETTTDIQAQAIPPALEGRDILGQAQTGTGKTYAFAIPIIEQIEDFNKKVQALILVPTRELALQVNKEIEELTQNLDIKSTTIFGGDSIERQIRELKAKPQIIVATPGRCIDLINRGKIKLQHIKFFALDEVDEMLNMGFLEDVEFIIEKMPEVKQTLLFSATMPEKIKRIANRYLVDPQEIKVKTKSIVADKVDQTYMIAKAKQKNLILKNIIDLNNEEKIIIFTQTKRSADEVTDFLLGYGLKVDKIHGDLAQKNRTLTIQKFRDNKIKYLVATDVVARGIDIDNIGLVINYELPQDIEYYIHRIGRTARGNAQKGRAITLVTPNIYNKEFRHYERQLKIKIKEEAIPKVEDVIDILKNKYIELEINKTKKKEKIYYDMAEELISKKDYIEVIADLLYNKYPQLSKEENLKLMKSDNNNSKSQGLRNSRNKNGNKNFQKENQNGKRKKNNKHKETERSKNGRNRFKKKNTKKN